MRIKFKIKFNLNHLPIYLALFSLTLFFISLPLFIWSTTLTSSSIFFSQPMRQQNLRAVDDLVTNGSFEKGTTGWAFWSEGTQGYKGEVVSEGYQGNSYRITTGKDQPNNWGRAACVGQNYNRNASFNNPANFAGKTLKLSGYIKTSAPTTQANFKVSITTPSGGRNPSWAGGGTNTVNSQSWQYVEKVIDIPADVTKIEVDGCSGGEAEGQAWFDKLDLSPDISRGVSGGISAAGLEGNAFTIEIPSSDQAVVIDNNTIARTKAEGSSYQVEICHLERGAWVCDLQSPYLASTSSLLPIKGGKGVVYSGNNGYPVAFGDWKGSWQAVVIEEGEAGGGLSAAVDPQTGKLAGVYKSTFDGWGYLWIEETISHLRILYAPSLYTPYSPRIVFADNGDAYITAEYYNYYTNLEYLPKIFRHLAGTPWVTWTGNDAIWTAESDNSSYNLSGVAIDNQGRLILAAAGGDSIQKSYWIFNLTPSFSLNLSENLGMVMGSRLAPSGGSFQFCLHSDFCYHRRNLYDTSGGSDVKLPSFMPSPLTPGFSEPMSVLGDQGTGVYLITGYSDKHTYWYMLTSTDPTLIAPSNLTAVSLGGTQVRLNWTDNSNNEEGFYFEWSVDDNNWQPISQTAPANATSITLSDSSWCGNIYFHIRAFNTYAKSGWSPSLMIATPPCPTHTPTPTATPTPTPTLTSTPTPTSTPMPIFRLYATAVLESQIDLNWIDEVNSGHDGYRIYSNSTSPLPPLYTEYQINDPTATSFSVTGLVCGRTWYHYIRVNRNGSGRASDNTTTTSLSCGPILTPTPTPTPIPCPLRSQGDANCDGIVNTLDYNTWLCEFTSHVPCRPDPFVDPNPDPNGWYADFSLNNQITLIDFEVWRKNKQ